MGKNQKVYLVEILDLIKNVWKFVGKIDEREMLKNHVICSAVLMQLTIIGEKTKKISSEIKSKIDLPWQEIAGFRNRAIHEYSHIDNKIVVSIVFESLKEMEVKIKKFLKLTKGV